MSIRQQLGTLLWQHGVANDALLDALDWKFKKLQAENDRLREAGDKLFWSAKEFVDDWKKGDFSLSTIAALDAQSLDDALGQYSIASALLAKEATDG